MHGLLTNKTKQNIWYQDLANELEKKNKKEISIPAIIKAIEEENHLLKVIDDDMDIKLDNTISSFNNTIESIENTIALLDSKISSCNNSIESLDSKLENLTNDVSELKNKFDLTINDLTNQIDLLKAKNKVVFDNGLLQEPKDFLFNQLIVYKAVYNDSIIVDSTSILFMNYCKSTIILNNVADKEMIIYLFGKQEITRLYKTQIITFRINNVIITGYLLKDLITNYYYIKFTNPFDKNKITIDINLVLNDNI